MVLLILCKKYSNEVTFKTLKPYRLISDRIEAFDKGLSSFPCDHAPELQAFKTSLFFCLLTHPA